MFTGETLKRRELPPAVACVSPGWVHRKTGIAPRLRRVLSATRAGYMLLERRDLLIHDPRHQDQVERLDAVAAVQGLIGVGPVTLCSVAFPLGHLAMARGAPEGEFRWLGDLVFLQGVHVISLCFHVALIVDPQLKLAHVLVQHDLAAAMDIADVCLNLFGPDSPSR